jgi:hypothetical protein
MNDSYYINYASDDISLSVDQDERDGFLCEVYELYRRGWSLGYLVSKVASFLTGIFLIILLALLVVCIDWSAILALETSSTISFGSIFVIKSPHPVIILMIAIAIFSIFARHFFTIFKYRRMRYLEQKLKLEYNVVKTHTWKMISTALCSNLASNDLEIRMRILRKENYQVGLWKSKCLGISFYTQPLDWCLDVCLWNYVFRPNNGILVEKVATGNESPKFLQFRLRCFGLLFLIVSPFVFVYYCLYSLFGYLEQVKTNPSIISGYTWSTSSKLHYRRYNELDVEFEDRLVRVGKKLDELKDASVSTTFAPLIRFVLFVLGSLAFSILIMSLINSNALTNIYIHTTNLVYVVGILSGAIYLLNNQLPDSSKLAKKQECTDALRNENMDLNFTEKYYRPRWQNYIYELLGIIVAPIQCLFVLPNRVENILEFLSSKTVNAGPITGSVCLFADFRQHANDRHMSESISALQG